MDIALVQVPQPRRITVYFAGSFGGQADPVKFHLLRGGVVATAIAAVWSREAAVVEVALVEPLLVGERYTLAHDESTTTADVAWLAPATPPTPEPRAGFEAEALGDPEAEVFGLDVAWFADAQDARGDFPVARGLVALRHDLAALTILNPAELIHRPRAGLGMRKRINATSSDAELQEQAASVRAAYLDDPRVRDASVEPVRSGERVGFRTSIVTPALAGESIDFTTRI